MGNLFVLFSGAYSSLLLGWLARPSLSCYSLLVLILSPYAARGFNCIFHIRLCRLSSFLGLGVWPERRLWHSVLEKLPLLSIQCILIFLFLPLVFSPGASDVDSNNRGGSLGRGQEASGSPSESFVGAGPLTENSQQIEKRGDRSQGEAPNRNNAEESLDFRCFCSWLCMCVPVQACL